MSGPGGPLSVAGAGARAGQAGKGPGLSGTCTLCGPACKRGNIVVERLIAFLSGLLS